MNKIFILGFLLVLFFTIVSGRNLLKATSKHYGPYSTEECKQKCTQKNGVSCKWKVNDKTLFICSQGTKCSNAGTNISGTPLIDLECVKHIYPNYR